MNSETYSILMEEYRLQREKNSRVEAERENEVFTAHPDIAELCHQRHVWIMNGIAGILQAGESVDLEKKMEDMNLEIRSRLISCGYPGNYLEPVYRCEICRDTGYAGDPVKHECACLMRRAREIEEKTAAGQASFERFDPSVFPDEFLKEVGMTQRKYMGAVRISCLQFANDFPAGSRNLVLYGPTGLGKTYLLKCIEKRLNDRGIDTVYVTAYRLLDDLRNEYFHPGSRSTEAYFDCGLLMIDDLGMEPLFDNVTVELLFNVLNERTLKDQGTAVSTNLTLNELKERYTERFFSRLLDSRAVIRIPFYGKDIRML